LEEGITMSEVASRWAWVASLALHFGVVGIGLVGPGRLVAPAWATDFWAGKTFEVPDDPSDHGEGDTSSSADESSNEINIDGLDPSPNTAAQTTPRTHAPGPAPVPPPARQRPAARTTLSSTAPASAHGAGQGGTFGAEAGSPGVRDLVRSFVRAVPIVASGDPVWSTLPLGAAGAADVTLALDEEGKPQVASGLSGPNHLRRLIQKTVSVMSGGRFGIASADGIASEQRVHVAVTLTQQSAPTEDEAASGGVFALRFEAPDEKNVSHAFFTLASGRRVEVSVRPRTR
jgi:hypothetical protein